MKKFNITSLIKVISSGKKPTSDNLDVGGIAFGKISDKPALFGNDGKEIIDLFSSMVLNGDNQDPVTIKQAGHSAALSIGDGTELSDSSVTSEDGLYDGVFIGNNNGVSISSVSDNLRLFTKNNRTIEITPDGNGKALYKGKEIHTVVDLASIGEVWTGEFRLNSNNPVFAKTFRGNIHIDDFNSPKNEVFIVEEDQDIIFDSWIDIVNSGWTTGSNFFNPFNYIGCELDINNMQASIDDFIQENRLNLKVYRQISGAPTSISIINGFPVPVNIDYEIRVKYIK